MEKAETEEDQKAMEKLDRKVKLTIAQSDAKYIGRAMQLFTLLAALTELYDNIPELAAINHKKRGAPFKYTHGLMHAIATLRSAFGLDLRTCAGMARVFLGENRDHPHYSQISRRINDLELSIKNGLSSINFEDVAVTLVPDGTGLTPATRSEYIRVVHKFKRGFLRLVIIINLETQEIVAHSLTDDKTGEATIAEDLLEDALVNLGINPEERRIMVKNQKHLKHKTYRELKLIADGGFDNRKFFAFCRDLGIIANIRVQTNSNARANGVDRARSEMVLEQLGGSKNTTPAELAAMNKDKREANRKTWKKDIGYGRRWLVEIVFSAFKRNYGDSVMATKMQNIRQEVKQKICLYNDMIRVGREAAMRA